MAERRQPVFLYTACNLSNKATTRRIFRPYCEAVLHSDRHINLDGSPAEPIDQQAKDLATKRLVQFAARKAAKKAKGSEIAVKPKHGPAPGRGRTSQAPEQLRDRVRASLLRRRA